MPRQASSPGALRLVQCAIAATLLLATLAASAHDEGEEDPKTGNAGSTGITTGPYTTFNLDVAAQLPLADIGGTLGNDIWGWTDALDGREYAIMGRRNGTSFVDVTDPYNPIYLGNLPSHTGTSVWRDMKVFADHAYIVSDLNGAHGMQVFDLTQLRTVVTPQTFTQTAHYAGFDRAHNIAINEDTGYAYAVGTNTYSGGLHFIDLSDPVAPVAAGGYAGDGYTHDAQAVIYNGPDADYAGLELVFASNEDTLSIINVDNKLAPSLIAKETYASEGYTHQGWLTEDHRYWLFNDELDEADELPGASLTRTHVFDVLDLDNPVYAGFYEHDVVSIDHNLYVHNGLVYEANYTSGLRILKPTDLSTASFELVAWVDTFPAFNNDTRANGFNGAWSVYPFFESGTIIVSDINSGLIVIAPVPEPQTALLLIPLLAIIVRRPHAKPPPQPRG